jgi:hypothetical protein
LVTQVDTHSDHKTPEINLAGKYCVVDANGDEHSSDRPSKSGLYYRGPCGSQVPGR